MRTMEIKVYQFNELSEKAKDTAKQNYKNIFGYAWSQEAIDSLDALAKRFGAKLKDYAIDWFNGSYSSAEFDAPEMEREEIAAILKTLGSYDPITLQGHGDCKLTGFCMDESAIDGFRRAFFAGESDLAALLQCAFDSWLKDGQADAEGQYEDEQFAEHCEANGYEFDERGERI